MRIIETTPSIEEKAILKKLSDPQLSAIAKVVSMQEAQWVKRLIDAESINLYGADGTPKRYKVTVVIQEI